MSITVCEEIILLTVNDEGKLLRWSEDGRARLRLLIAKPGWLERHGDRFHRVRRVFADRIALRTVPRLA